MLVNLAGEGVGIGKALFERAFKECLGIEDAGLCKNPIGGIDIYVKVALRRINIDVEAVEVVPGTVVDAFLDGRHGTDALDVLMRVGTAEQFAIYDEGCEGRMKVLHNAKYLIYALAIALGQFLPLVEVFTVGNHRGALGKLDFLPVA